MPIAKTIDRRLFLAGAVGVSLAGAANATLIAPGASAGETRALEAIAAYLQSHRRHHGLPAMGMVMVMVMVAGGRHFTILSRRRGYRETQPLAGGELWQNGVMNGVPQVLDLSGRRLERREL
ncbi:hypothetical protein [Sandarakinorhabdus sp.]|uniref:hypothetical protein n=1 Tax=Sandarakinorhabdus sp. TaxID=1916663 RepID=UPI00356A20F0